ncbi:MAG: ABC transporter permease subunit [Janthinobacterium lividum]
MRLISACLLTLLLALAAITVLRSPWGYAMQDRTQTAAGSSAVHLAGTDELGRDRLVRTSTALLLGLGGAVAASALASALAVSLGTAAAFTAPWAGRSLLYFSDLFLTLPWIFLLMMVRAALPLSMAPMQSAAMTFLLLGILGVPAFVRIHYTQTLTLRRSEWLLHGRATGLRPRQIARQLLPHLRPLLLTQFVLYVPACIVAEANLGTLGLGISEPLASWGSMLQSLQSDVFLSNSSLVYLPIALLIFVLTLLELLVFKPREANS